MRFDSLRSSVRRALERARHALLVACCAAALGACESNSHGAMVKVTIPPGASLHTAADSLHRAGLVEHITTANPAMILRGQYLGELFATRSADPVLAQQQRWAALDHTVNSQSLLLSFADVFFYVALAFLASLPLLLLLDKGSNQTAAAAAH